MSRDINVLLCDDDPLLLELVSFRLGADGHKIITCADGLDALVVLRSTAVDVAILDAIMPGLDGLELLSTIRKDPKLSALPVIMLSAKSRETDIVSALRLGADDYIVKPFIPDELALRLSKLIRQRKLEAVAA
jgi:two-component system alkaline phosphatase synthesis response regulator PhoP